MQLEIKLDKFNFSSNVINFFFFKSLNNNNNNISKKKNMKKEEYLIISRINNKTFELLNELKICFVFVFSFLFIFSIIIEKDIYLAL
jgi:hypothetical protein